MKIRNPHFKNSKKHKAEKTWEKNYTKTHYSQIV